MTHAEGRAHPWLPDEDTWDNPARLTAADLYAEAGAGRSDGGVPADDPEDER